MNSFEIPGNVAYIDPKISQTDGVADQYKTLISRRHPFYADMCVDWDFFESTYHGGRKWFEENIFRYYKEGEQDFNDRMERAFRFNHSREVVDLVTKYLFKQNILRSEDAPRGVQHFWKKATKLGADISDLAKQIAKNTSIYGRIGVVIDNDWFNEKYISLKDEKAGKGHPYAYIVTPQQMLDYAFDEVGELRWILIREIVRDDVDPFTSSGDQRERFRLWTKDSWYLFEADKKGKVDIVSVGEHKLGVVPVVLADHLLTDEEYGSPSMINDIAYLDRATANYLSNLDEIIQGQTFSQLIIPTSAVDTGDSDAKLMEVGTKRVFLYQTDGSSRAPEYISPDPTQAKLILDTVNRIVDRKSVV